MAISEERRLYQELINDQCSDNHWRQVVNLLKRNKLEVTKENVSFFYSIRSSIPRSAIKIDGILTLYSQVVKLTMNNKAEYTGEKIHQMIKAKGILPPQPTFCRWFTSLGGYRKKKKYTAEQFKVVMLKALIYKAYYQEQNKLVGE